MLHVLIFFYHSLLLQQRSALPVLGKGKAAPSLGVCSPNNTQCWFLLPFHWQPKPISVLLLTWGKMSFEPEHTNLKECHRKMPREPFLMLLHGSQFVWEQQEQESQVQCPPLLYVRIEPSTGGCEKRIPQRARSCTWNVLSNCWIIRKTEILPSFCNYLICRIKTVREKKKKFFKKKVSMLKNIFVRLFFPKIFFIFFFPPGKTTWMYSETILPI